MKLLDAAKKFGLAVLHGIEWPFTHTAHLAVVLDKTFVAATDAVEHEPQVQGLILALVQNFEKLGPDVVADIASKGLDISADAKTVEDLKSAFEYFQTTFLPQIEVIYKDVAANVQAVQAASQAS